MGSGRTRPFSCWLCHPAQRNSGTPDTTASSPAVMLSCGCRRRRALVGPSNPDHLLNRTQQRIEVKGPVMAHDVNKEGRRAVHAAADAAHKIFTDAWGV